jgi:hypothetical protein
MYRAALACLAASALVLAAGSVRSTAMADDKPKDTKSAKDDKARSSKDSDKKLSKAGVIEITKGKDDKFRFFVRDGEGKLLAMSGPGGFATPKEAEEAIDRMKEVLAKAKVSVEGK